MSERFSLCSCQHRFILDIGVGTGGGQAAGGHGPPLFVTFLRL